MPVRDEHRRETYLDRTLSEERRSKPADRDFRTFQYGRVSLDTRSHPSEVLKPLAWHFARDFGRVAQVV